jgi:hypothetical protein
VQLSSAAPDELAPMQYSASIGFDEDPNPPERVFGPGAIPLVGMPEEVTLETGDRYTVFLHAIEAGQFEQANAQLTQNPDLLSFAYAMAADGFADVDAEAAFNLADALNAAVGGNWRAILDVRAGKGTPGIARWYVESNA